MKKDVYLFYCPHHDPLTFFKIRKSDLRNPNIVVDYRNYNDNMSWKTFISSFISTNNRYLLDNNLVIDRDYEGFILSYYDTILEKNVIVTDPQTIVDKILE